MQPAPQHTPPGPPPLSQTLRNAIEASKIRAEEGQRVFGPISALWDGYVDSDTVRQLPTKLRKPLLVLCQEMSRIATAHFDAYLKGQRANRSSYTPQTPTSSQLGSNTDITDTEDNNEPAPLQSRLPTPPATYAQMAAQAPLTQPVRTSQTRKVPVKEPARTRTRPDTRLFIRLSPDHKARKPGPFAILVALKELLGTDSALIQEVQEVPTGLALCTSSLEALNKLEGLTEALQKFFGECTIQKQALWTTYRLTNVPRTINTLDGLGQIVNNTVTDGILADAIRELTGQTATRAIEAKESTESGLFHTSWIISYLSTGHTPLPRTLRILGATATSSAFKPKAKTIQCNRCYKWHNARYCILPQHCRTCGSTKHLEETHTTRCTAPSPHTCPARCLHCSGPHPADYPHCPLRPTARGPKTRSERAVILETSKLARVRACTTAKCQSAHARSIRDSQNDHSRMETSSPSPRTPTRTHPDTSATTLFQSRPPFTGRSQAIPISLVPFHA